jgi:hypothetical protein
MFVLAGGGVVVSLSSAFGKLADVPRPFDRGGEQAMQPETYWLASFLNDRNKRRDQDEESLGSHLPATGRGSVSLAEGTLGKGWHMLKMASIDLFGRRAVIVESEADTIARLTEDLAASGGHLVRTFATVEAALGFCRSSRSADCVIIDVAHATTPNRPLTELFAELGIAVVFVTGFDDWFLEDDDDIEDVPVPLYAYA